MKGVPDKSNTFPIQMQSRSIRLSQTLSITSKLFASPCIDEQLPKINFSDDEKLSALQKILKQKIPATI